MASVLVTAAVLNHQEDLSESAGVFFASVPAGGSLHGVEWFEGEWLERLERGIWLVGAHLEESAGQVWIKVGWAGPWPITVAT